MHSPGTVAPGDETVIVEQLTARPDPEPVKVILPMNLFVLVTDNMAWLVDPRSKSTGVIREIVKPPTWLSNVAL